MIRPDFPQRGKACGQRGWKWHPVGGFNGEGISPRMAMNTVFFTSIVGTQASSACVYGSLACPYPASAPTRPPVPGT